MYCADFDLRPRSPVAAMTLTAAQLDAAAAAVFALGGLAVYFGAGRRSHWASRGAGAVNAVVAQRTAGAVCLGFLPVAAAAAVGRPLAREYDGFGVVAALPPAWFAALTALVIWPAVAVSGYRGPPGGRRNHPELPVVPSQPWSTATLLTDAVSWGLYLFAYELLFRGFLLFPLAAALGEWSAVLATSALYAAAHADKGPTEVAASAALGVPLAWAALAPPRSVLPVFVAHWGIAAIFTAASLIAVGALPRRRWC